MSSTVEIDENILYVLTWNEIHVIISTEISKIFKKRIYLHIFATMYTKCLLKYLQVLVASGERMSLGDRVKGKYTAFKNFLKKFALYTVLLNKKIKFKCHKNSYQSVMRETVLYNGDNIVGIIFLESNLVIGNKNLQIVLFNLAITAFGIYPEKMSRDKNKDLYTRCSSWCYL